MDNRIQKHRMMRWLGRVLVVLSLVTPCGVQATVETVPPIGTQFVLVSDWSKHSSCYDACASVVPSINASYNPYFNVVLEGVRFASSDYPTDTPERGGGNYYCEYRVSPTNRIMRAAMCTTIAVCPPGYGFYVQPDRCVRNVPDNYTITLTGGTEVEPSKGSDIKTLPIIATVKDQNNQPPTSPVKVHVSFKVDPKSGGHDHGDSTRPRGGISDPKGGIADVKECASDSECWSKQTDGNGKVEFDFKAPEASGKHTITVSCDGCSNTATKPVGVKVNGLETIPAFPYYTLVESNGDVIGATGGHSHNHNLLPAAAQVLMRIAVAYRFDPRLRVLDWRTNTMVPPPPLHVNDASLEWGGKFDIKGNWTGSHAEHRRGTSVDLRANENVGAIQPELFEEFESQLGEIIPGDRTKRKYLRECTPNERPTESNPNPIQHNRRPRNYCVSQVDGSFDNNRHFHVRLMGE